MTSATCAICSKPKATLTCGICEASICKSCTQFLSEDAFSFLLEKPSELTKTTFCEPCFSEKIQPQLSAYEDLVEQAKNVAVFYKEQYKETRFVNRKEKKISAQDLASEEDVIMNLAFRAIQKGYDSIVDLETVSKKIVNGRYQTSSWSGSAIPTNTRRK